MERETKEKNKFLIQGITFDFINKFIARLILLICILLLFTIGGSVISGYYRDASNRDTVARERFKLIQETIDSSDSITDINFDWLVFSIDSDRNRPLFIFSKENDILGIAPEAGLTWQMSRGNRVKHLLLWLDDGNDLSEWKLIYPDSSWNSE